MRSEWDDPTASQDGDETRYTMSSAGWPIEAKRARDNEMSQQYTRSAERPVGCFCM